VSAPSLEEAVRQAWVAWGYVYSGYYLCDGCGEMRYCRARRKSRWLCLDCFDQR
jgi:formylmethanofuran dehydrogenase subunit E